jgi:hypothetical protein
MQVVHTRVWSLHIIVKAPVSHSDVVPEFFLGGKFEFRCWTIQSHLRSK